MMLRSILCKAVFALTVFISAATASNTTYFLDVSDRPSSVIEAIDVAYNAVASDQESKWTLHNGKCKYNFLADDHLVAEKIIRQAPIEQVDFYFMDIGCGIFFRENPDGSSQLGWGRSLAKFLNSRDFGRDIRAHIFSLRGECNLGQEVTNIEKCILYEFGNFKVEDLAASLDQKVPGLANKFDMIVTNWTLRHLVDPVGTFVQSYNILRPLTGLFFFDGFFFSDREGFEDISSADNRKMMLSLLESSGVTFLVLPNYRDLRLGNYVVKRTDNTTCKLPMQYIKALKVGEDYLIGSQYVTHFVFKYLPKPMNKWNRITEPTDDGDDGLVIRGDEFLFNWFRDILGTPKTEEWIPY